MTNPNREVISCTKEGGHIVETAVEARAGFLDKPTLTVLIVSTILTIAMFVLIYSFVFAP